MMKATWKKKEKVKELRESCGHSALWVPSISKVLITGGFDEKAKIRDVRELNVNGETSTIRKGRKMHYHFSHLAKNGKVYIIGMSSKNSDGQVLCYTTYDPKSNEWSKTYALNVSFRVGFCAVSISENTFLIFGGHQPKNTKSLYNDMYRMEIGKQGKLKCIPLCSSKEKLARAYVLVLTKRESYHSLYRNQVRLGCIRWFEFRVDIWRIRTTKTKNL